MKIIEHNVETGEIIERDATKDEIAQAKIDAQIAEERASIIEAKTKAKEAALAKLEALGLDAEEVAALLA